MRRVLVAALLAVSSIGIFAIPAVADGGANDPNKVALSFDFSDNDVAASVSNGAFNIITDVLPEHTAGLVRMIAIAPDGTNDPTMICPFQTVQQSQVECAFTFPDSGVWVIKAQYQPAPKTDVTTSAIIRLRVGN
ncbi:MAG TPA: hypothetical protein PLG60_07455 [Acidimicrobiales bacterium]|nr:hypothetical protein [Acidimicrobiales bacterium]